MRKGNWVDHPELVRLRDNYRERQISAEEVAEIKLEIENQKKVEPVVRVVEDNSFKPAMSFWVRRNVVPILSKTR